MPLAGGWFLMLTAALAGCGAAQAQTTFALSAGGTSVRYDGFERSNGLSFSPSFSVERGSAFLSASGDFARFNGAGGASALGELAGSWFSQPRREGTLRLEIGGTASTSAYRSAIRNTFLAAHARAHLSSDRRGGWLSASAGYLSHTSSFGSMVSADAGAWTRISSAMLSAILTASRFPWANPVVPLELDPLATSEIPAFLDWTGPGRYETTADFTASLHAPVGRAELDAVAGTRLAGHFGARRQWASIAGSFWLTRRIALTGRAGTYPSRIERGFPSASFASVGLRLRSRPRATRFAFVAPRSTATALDVQWRSSESATLRVTAPGARRVDLRADFTDWRSLPMSRSDAGVWEITMPLAPGSYRATLRIDGGAWAPPPGTQGVADEFGEFVGIVIIPERE
ncbi:MAG: glycogen-binding domain-containing protein [Gemmatimonadaceae bacterium]